MKRKVLEKLEEHEQEDRMLEAGSWRELFMRDYANGREVIAAAEEMLRTKEPAMRNLPLLYHYMRQQGEVFSLGGPVRTGKRFSLRKHATCFAAYYHSHDFYELLYVYRGKMIQYEPQTDIPEAFPRGSACLLAPGMVHAMAPASERDMVFKTVIPESMFEKISSFCPNQTAELKKIWDRGILKVRSGGGNLERLMEMLAEEQLGGKEPSDERVCANLSMIFSELARLGERSAGRSRFMEELETYFRGKDAGVSLEQMAKDMGYSADYLGRKIRSETGESFTRIRQHFFLEQAAKILAEGNLSVEETAAGLGYRSISSFYRLFQKEYGISPGEYRRGM